MHSILFLLPNKIFYITLAMRVLNYMVIPVSKRQQEILFVDYEKLLLARLRMSANAYMAFK